ncbi:cysteine hydrolase [Candidatus Woesearchaeota archaeon]|nr:cysteine hydrolase [Candidatus Woesearchaeota archaeon]
MTLRKNVNERPCCDSLGNDITQYLLHDKNNKGLLFWNVDTQYDFMRPDGKLYVPDAEQIEPNLEYLTRLAAERNIRVINTADWHTPTSAELSDKPDFKTTFPPHCLQGTKGAEYIPATRPENPFVINWQDFAVSSDYLGARNTILYKDRFDVFDKKGNPFTDVVLTILRPRRAIVYGVATNVCVDFAVKGLLKMGIKVYVPTDAIKELPNLPLEEVLQEWQKLGAHLTKVNDVAGYLDQWGNSS